MRKIKQILLYNTLQAKEWLSEYQTVKAQLDKLTQTLASITREADRVASCISSGRAAQPGSQSDWKQVEEGIISAAHVICTTLSMSGIDKLDFLRGEVDCLIVDEACQATEPATLIPFALEPKRAILVGDHKQLPATTISENAEATRFNRSFFERLLANGFQRELLTVQYRMHPQIR